MFLHALCTFCEGNILEYFLHGLFFTVTRLMKPGVELSSCDILSKIKRFSFWYGSNSGFLDYALLNLCGIVAKVPRQTKLFLEEKIFRGYKSNPSDRSILRS